MDRFGISVQRRQLFREQSRGDRDDIWSTKSEVKAATPHNSALSVVDVDSDYISSDDSLEEDSEGDDVG